MATKKVYLWEKFFIFDAWGQKPPLILTDVHTKGIVLLPTEDLPVISRSQLALRNGQDKPEIWVAYNHLVYDVTSSRLWQRGKHYEHWAGQDLTDELEDAPHTDKVFDKFRVIGRLQG